MLERAKVERQRKIEADFEALAAEKQKMEEVEPEVEEEAPVAKKRRKPARRVIVTEASSGTDEDEEVEVVLPKKKMSHEEVRYRNAMSKMFTYL